MTGAMPPRGQNPADYASAVQPILFKHCVQCHSPGQVAPFSLLTYEDARKWAPMIAQATASRRMPPWKAASDVGEFQDENRLSQVEVDRIASWHQAGTPRGDASFERSPNLPPSGWPMGKPDLVLVPGKAYPLAAGGVDEYRHFSLPTKLKETRYVRAVAVSPGVRNAVHHVVLFIDDLGVSQDLEKSNDDGKAGYPGSTFPGFIPSGCIGIWAPGWGAVRLPEGTGIELKKGTTLVAQIHYNKTGKDELDRSRIGLYFTAKRPARRMEVEWFLKQSFAIPPGGANHRIEASFAIDRDTLLHSVWPHMHLIGKSMSAELVKPDGSITPVIKIENWDFKWQLQYRLKTPLLLPKGSELRISAIYDNSANNPNNPNKPPKEIRYGEYSRQEMMVLVGFVTDP